MKKRIRKELIKKRKNISKEEIYRKSSLIKNNLFDLDEFTKASNILFYVSYDNEVFTHEMIKESIHNGKNIFVPKSVEKDRSLIISKLDEWDDLEKGLYGILEPVKIKEVSISEIEIVIVPAVGFDKKGNRVGHGKGYYDNLIKFSKDILFIGLAFEFQIVDNIPVNRYDFPVDMIITESRIINCLNS